MTAARYFKRLRSFFQQVDKLFFPPTCLSCRSAVPSAGTILCEQCRAQSNLITDNYCLKCGAPLDEGKCEACASTSFSFAFARAAYPYQDSIKTLIHQFKYGGFRSTASFLSREMVKLPSSKRFSENFDMLIPVPLHHVKRRMRGFNQSLVLTRRLSALLNVPYAKPVVRVANTLSQTNLSREARIKNLRGAFRLKWKANIKGKSIIIVDDVFTTGSTVNEIAGLLMQNGAAKVAVLTAARAV